jgi:hypothetical protein
MCAVVLAAAMGGCSGTAQTPAPTPAVPSSAATPGAGSPASSKPATPGLSPHSAASPATSGVIDINALGASKIAAPDSPNFAILADGYLFTTDVNGGMETYDLSGNAQPKPDLGGACAAPDAGFGAVWTATCDGTSGLIRVDTSSFGAAPVDIGGQIPAADAMIGVGEDGVWMIRLTGKKTELIRVSVQVQDRSVNFTEDAPPGATGVRVGLGAVWTLSPSRNEVTRIDPAAGTTVATIMVGANPLAMAVDEEAVWTLNGDGTMSRIDPAGNNVAATITLGEPVQSGAIAFGGGFVWVRGSNTLLFKIDPATNQVVARYGPAAGPGGDAADDSNVWITSSTTNTIWRLPLS